MFHEMDKHDLGCGPGGGTDSAAVLTNAGVIIIGDTVALADERKSNVPLESLYETKKSELIFFQSGCLERKLKKRAISEEISEIIRS